MLTDGIRTRTTEPFQLTYDEIQIHCDKIENEFIQPTGNIYPNDETTYPEMIRTKNHFISNQKKRELRQQLLEL